MDNSTSVVRRTRAHLDHDVSANIGAIVTGYQPVYAPDGRPRRMTAYDFGRLLRKLKILRWLERLEFGSFLDLASGFDHYPYLVRCRYGATTYYSDMVHRLNLPFGGLTFGKVDHTVTLQLPRLPFRDGAFDVVLCSEVFEHLVRPVEALAELLRITRRYLVLTSLEALASNRWERWRAHVHVDTRVPHVERNWLLLSEFEALLGENLWHENLQYAGDLPAHPFAPAPVQEAAYAAIGTRAGLVDALCRAVAEPRHAGGGMGILLVKAQPGAPLPVPAPPDDRPLTEWLIDMAVREEQHVQATLAMAAVLKDENFPSDVAYALMQRPVAPALRALLCCPNCRGTLTASGVTLHCASCAASFPSHFGVPILYPTRQADDDGALAAALDRLCGSDRARRRRALGVARRLRRAEGPPSLARRALWRVEGRG